MESFQAAKESARKSLIAKNYVDAIKEYQSLLDNYSSQMKPNELAITNSNLGLCLMHQEKYKEALIYLDKSIEIDPLYFKSHYRKAQVLLELKEFVQALEITQQLMSKEPCKDVYDLKQKICTTMLKHSNMYDFEAIKKDLDECTREKEYQQVFVGLYSRPEDLESYHAILDEEHGFCQQLLKYSREPQVLVHSLKFVHYIWTQIKNVLKDKRFFIPEWLTQYLISNYGLIKSCGSKTLTHYYSLLKYSNIIYGNVLEQLSILMSENQDDFLDKNLLDIVNLYSLNVKYVEKCSPEELDSICNQRKRFFEVCLELNFQYSKVMNKIFVNEKEIDFEKEQVHLIWELMISILKISGIVFDQLKKFKYSIRDPFSYSYFQRDTFTKKNLFSLISIIGANQQRFYQINTVHKFHDKILQTLIHKRDSIKSVQLIKFLLALVIRDEEFCKHVSESPLADPVIRGLQDYLKEHRKDEVSTNYFRFTVLYLTILFQVNTRAKFLQLYDYLVLIDCDRFIEKIFSSELHISDTLTLLTYIGTFDDAKKIFIKRTSQLVEYVNRTMNEIQLQDQKSSVLRIQNYSLSVSMLHFLYELCLDQSKDHKESQKERFGIDDEQYRMAKELEKKYKPEGSTDPDQFFKYDQKFITKHKVLQLVGQQLNAIKFISNFVAIHETTMTEFSKKLVAEVLSRLSDDDELVPHLFDKRSLRLVAQICLAGKLNDGFVYLSKVMSQANPNLFEYKDVHLLIEALLQSALSSKHELHIFKSLLGLIQLTSLGDDSCQRLAQPGNLVTLQNFMLEENHYIVHAALQVFNNVALSNRFQKELEDKELQNLFKIIGAQLQAQYDRLLKFFVSKKKNQQFDDEQMVSDTDFSHPLKIVQTLIGICAIVSFSEKVRKTHQADLELIVNPEFYTHLITITRECPDDIVQLDIFHKLSCIIDNYDLKVKLDSQLQLLKNAFEPLRKKLQKQKLEQIDKEKVEKIVKIYE